MAMQLDKIVDSAARNSGIGLAFAYLLALSIGSVCLVVCLLTAYQFQHGIRTAEIEGKSVQLWKVIELSERWSALRESNTSAAKGLEIAQGDLKEKQDTLRRTQDELGALEPQLTSLSFDLRTKLAELGVPSKKIEEDLSSVPFFGSGSVFADLENQVPNANPDKKKKFDESLKNFNETWALVNIAEAKKASANRQMENSKAVVDGLAKAANTVGSPFQQLLDSEVKDKTSQQMLGNFLSQLNTLHGSSFGILGMFATTEPDFLTLLLVLAMGTLGGTLHLSRLYIEGKATSVGYFLFRPFLGATAALVIFVVARTGVFVIAEPGNQAKGAPLSPFFISFVAIVSGLLAEQAIAKLQGLGSSWFQDSLVDTTDRYALRVADEAEAQNKTKEQFQKFASLSEVDADALFDGQKKVTAATQKLVSVWLAKPVRDLFTDMAPDEPVKP
jgi:hypothetical protein